MMKSIFITRRIPDIGINMLMGKVNVEIFEKDEPISYIELIDRVKDKDGILSMLTDRIDAEVMNKALKLKIISNYAVGYNNIDVQTATRKNIIVTNTPGVLTDATADLTLALLLSLVRHIPAGDRYMREDRFNGWAPMLLLGTELKDKILGIVGMGRIGLEVARRSIGFKMKCIYNNIHRVSSNIEKELRIEFKSLKEVFRESDFISLHVPLTPENNHMVDEHLLKLMKPTAYLINTARGELIDEIILIKVLKAHKIAGAAIDVFEGEPCVNSELYDLDNLVMVPHIGSATVETRNRMAQMAAQNLLDGLEGKKPELMVNPEVFKQ
ncbi:MAG: D-glycerate dehydrogenase [Candidatus Schekmanbacteria bacterium RBG_13_48_7]|uniref:D-glycerate dehydrogenase n=1 Tax=Candidatus Schekmanbacteria bacterium RBG_13_48_7 TaxID=1817878 RepID=A0A1F7RYU9_9BACT|nr:MAG: D-glycerate dehydrogenase [Candidatus Schekmanbacteria bacterium RBG_13_48_7]